MRSGLFLVAVAFAGASGCGDTCGPVGGYRCDTLPSGTKVEKCGSDAHLSVVQDCVAAGEQCFQSAWFMESSAGNISDPSSYGCAAASCSDPCFTEGQSWCLLDTVRTCVKTSTTCMQAESAPMSCSMMGKRCVESNGAASCV